MNIEQMIDFINIEMLNKNSSFRLKSRRLHSHSGLEGKKNTLVLDICYQIFFHDRSPHLINFEKLTIKQNSSYSSFSFKNLQSLTEIARGAIWIFYFII